MERAERRHGVCRPASGAARVCAVALRADSILQPAPYDPSRADGMGAGALWIWSDAGRGPRKAGVRSLLHQAHDSRARSIDYVRDGEDDLAAPGRAIGPAVLSGRLARPYSQV